MSKFITLKDKYILDLKEGDIITILLDSNNCEIEYRILDGDYKILVFNNYNGSVDFKDYGFIKNANVEITYIDLNNYNLIQNSNIEVLDNSTLTIDSMYNAILRKTINYNLTNVKKDTLVQISNFACGLKDADFSLNVVGNILKGAKRAKHYQKSHCLTIENVKKCLVKPVLNIDENDVEASHSLSSGTIDQEILYYLNSRGLKRNEALLLLVQSYLLKDKEFFEGFKNGDYIYEQCLRKVESLCLM